MVNQFDGIVILRNNSTSQWIDNKDYVMYRGECGIEFMKDGSVRMKVGDGVTSWENLTYACGNQHRTFEVNIAEGSNHQLAIESATLGICIGYGDVAIVKEDVEGHLIYTAYIYDGSKWVATNGNYNAKNIYFDEDLIFTKSLGAVEVPEGQSVIVPTRGKNLIELFNILTKNIKQGGCKEAPKVLVVLKDSGEHEVGEKIVPTFSAILFGGEYTFGPTDTCVSAKRWKLTTSNGSEIDTPEGIDEELTITDSCDYFVTAEVEHTEGCLSYTNTQEVSDFYFEAGTLAAESEHITGYRKSFFGAVKEELPIESSEIRKLNGFNANKQSSFDIEVEEGSKEVILALYGKKLVSVVDSGAFNSDIIDSFEVIENVPVGGANDYIPLNYVVYLYKPVGELNATILNCKIEDEE